MTTNTMSSLKQVLAFCKRLREEHLFVQIEQDNLQSLYRDIIKSTERLYRQAWMSWQQKLLGEMLLSRSCPLSTRSLCLLRRSVEQCHIVDAYRVVQNRETLYSELFTRIRDEPELLAQLVHRSLAGDAAVVRMIHTILGSVHGFFLFPEDQYLSLRFVRKLIALDLHSASSPRRVMKNAQQPFPSAFKILAEHLHEAKVFLAAALRESVLLAMARDSMFLDADPNKAPYHLSGEERRERFGLEGTEQYSLNLAAYRQQVCGMLGRIFLY